jgi:Family of unknown function (DUF6174)
MPVRERTFLAAILLLGLALIGCSNAPTSPVWASIALSKAQSQWRGAGLSSYQFRSSVSCFCGDEYRGPLRVTVRQGRVTAVVDIATGASRPLTYRQPVDSVFGLVRTEIAERPNRLQVTYDPSLGFPKTLTYGTPENDGGGYITIDSVQAIP